MTDSNLKFYLSGSAGGAHTKFSEAPALTDADGESVGMSIEGWGGIGEFNAGLRFFPNDWFGIGVRAGGTLQGGSKNVVDTIDSDNPDAYYAAAECDKYIPGGVGNVGSAGNCGVGDPLDTSQFNWDRSGVSIFVPFTYRARRLHLEVAPGLQHEWGTGSAHIMIPTAEGFVDLENLTSVKLEASAGLYFGNPEKTQVGVLLALRTTLASQGEIFVPGEDRHEAIPGAGNQSAMLRVEVEFDTDRKEGSTDRAAARAAARTSDPTTTGMTEDQAIKKVTTDFTATMSGIGAKKVPGSDLKYLYARGETNFSAYFVGKNAAKNPRISALVLDHTGEPTDFGYVIMAQDVDSLETTQLKNPDRTYLTFAELRVAVLRGDFDKPPLAASGAVTTMAEAEAIEIMNQRMTSAMNDIHATASRAAGYYSVVERGTAFTFIAVYVPNPTNDPRVSALILNDAGQSTGHGYKIRIKVGSTEAGYFNKNDGTFYTFEDTARIFNDPHTMEDMFGLEVSDNDTVDDRARIPASRGIRFESTSTTFDVGTAPEFIFTGEAVESIEMVSLLKEDGSIKIEQLDFDTDSNTLVVEELAEISRRDKTAATVSVPGIDSTKPTAIQDIQRRKRAEAIAQNANAGKNITYRLKVHITGREPIELTATSE